MDKITDVTIKPIEGPSKYIRPLRIHFKQDGKPRIWDTMKNHDSVAAVVHNISRDVLLFVQQFRPAVYINRSTLQTNGNTSIIDPETNPGSWGLTLELCAGIVDKDASVAEIMKEEILEELGYDVPMENISKITSFRSGVGIAGALQTLFYAEVTDEMKTGPGGGNSEEGERIDIVEYPAKECLKLVYDDSIQRPGGFLFALMWFDDNILKKDRLMK